VDCQSQSGASLVEHRVTHSRHSFGATVTSPPHLGVLSPQPVPKRGCPSNFSLVVHHSLRAYPSVAVLPLLGSPAEPDPKLPQVDRAPAEPTAAAAAMGHAMAPIPVAHTARAAMPATPPARPAAQPNAPGADPAARTACGESAPHPRVTMSSAAEASPAASLRYKSKNSSQEAVAARSLRPGSMCGESAALHPATTSFSACSASWAKRVSSRAERNQSRHASASVPPGARSCLVWMASSSEAW